MVDASVIEQQSSPILRRRSMAAETLRRPSFIPSVIYKDNHAALAWLERAFGFEASELLVDDQDNIVHAEMSHGDGVVMIGSEFTSWAKSPASIGGANTQRIHVRIERDIDAHYERAKAAGAVIERPLADQFYGDRVYAAMDLEGHHWTFSQAVRQVTAAEMEEATGFRWKARA
jgi:uncharacterized glyoxalase superfamily protein PhnB